MPFPVYVYHVTMRTHLPLSLEVVEKRRVGADSGPTFRRLWTKVHEVLVWGSRRFFVVSNSVLRLSINLPLNSEVVEKRPK